MLINLRCLNFVKRVVGSFLHMPDIRHHDLSSLCTERTLIWPLFIKVSRFGPFTRRADFYQSLEAVPKSHESPYQALETCTFLLF